MEESVSALEGFESFGCHAYGDERLRVVSYDACRSVHPEDAFIADFMAVLDARMQVDATLSTLAFTLAQAALDEIEGCVGSKPIDGDALLSCSATLASQSQVAARERTRMLSIFKSFLCAQGFTLPRARRGPSHAESVVRTANAA